MANLLAAVGTGGTNARVDVTAVQNLINQSIRTITPLGYLQVSGVCDSLTINAILTFQRRVVMLTAPDGRVDPGGRTLQALNISASGGTYFPGLLPIPSVSGAVQSPASATPKVGTNGRYTDNPNEVVTKNTVPNSKDVVAMLLAGWTDLTEQGARTLTAQFLHETGGAKYCFNWNLGNIKPIGSSTPHMYLRNTWEGLPTSYAEEKVARSKGLAHIATTAEIKAHGWRIPGKTVVVFQPPHDYARFVAYPSLTVGAGGWMKHHKGVASRQPNYIASVNAGDCTQVAFLLKADRYYTGDAGIYAHSMVSKKAELDRTLGPIV